MKYLLTRNLYLPVLHFVTWFAVIGWERTFFIYIYSASGCACVHHFHSHVIEWFSFECRKTKTKVITLTNHKGHRQYSEPIKTRSNYRHVADAKRCKTWVSKSQLVLVVLLIGWKSGASFLSQSFSVESAKQITFRHSNENHSKWVVVWKLFVYNLWYLKIVSYKLHLPKGLAKFERIFKLHVPLLGARFSKAPETPRACI